MKIIKSIYYLNDSLYDYEIDNFIRSLNKIDKNSYHKATNILSLNHIRWNLSYIARKNYLY